jgi:hypothetical protein
MRRRAACGWPQHLRNVSDGFSPDFADTSKKADHVAEEDQRERPTMERHLGLDTHTASSKLAVISEKGRELRDFAVEANGHAAKLQLKIRL